MATAMIRWRGTVPVVARVDAVVKLLRRTHIAGPEQLQHLRL
jgi:hypothetical protein